MLYKPDWEETKLRYQAWWAHEALDRCALWVTVPRDNAPPDPPPRPPADPVARRTDLDYLSALNEYGFRRTFFGARHSGSGTPAIPATPASRPSSDVRPRLTSGPAGGTPSLPARIWTGNRSNSTRPANGGGSRCACSKERQATAAARRSPPSALSAGGLFGETYYAEGEYIHELKQLNEITIWRRRWQTGINGITYGTHSLGPISQWMPGDRVVSVCCAGGGHHYKDPRGKAYENEDGCVMLCKTAKGGLIKIRVDMLSDRPHAMTNYSLQDTDGAYESARGGPGEIDKVWLRSRSKGMNWQTLCDFEDEFLPKYWEKASAEAAAAGHGGGDYFEIMDFADAVTGRRPCPIGIHAAMDMTLPGLVSRQSMLEGGRWLPVPNSREW